MNSIIELNQAPPDPQAGAPALPPAPPSDDPQLARVPAAQQLLFASDPRGVCHEIGLNWWAAIKLFEDGWISFSPESTHRLDEAQEAELRFIGALAAAGCDRAGLQTLLAGLEKPYAYRVDRLCYDWVRRRWRLLPEPHPHPEAVFADWIEELTARGDLSTLAGVIELAHDAINRVRQTSS